MTKWRGLNTSGRHINAHILCFIKSIISLGVNRSVRWTLTVNIRTTCIPHKHCRCSTEHVTPCRSTDCVISDGNISARASFMNTPLIPETHPETMWPPRLLLHQSHGRWPTHFISAPPDSILLTWAHYNLHGKEPSVVSAKHISW